MSKTNRFPVVGIGASAGGVEALGGFFRAMPNDSGMAYVLVMHMPIGHETTLPEILQRMTGMPVSAVKNGEPLAPNHVYVCPADQIVTINGNTLQLQRRTSAAQAKPIDVFFSALAEALDEDAIGVILSGAGSDGALGLKAIKERGGLTLAQGTDGTGPKQSSMPDSAIATGVVDLVVPVEDMAKHLVEFAADTRKLERAVDSKTQGETDEEADAAHQEICRILKQQIGHDFSGYKNKTFLRRTRRRMQIVQAATFADYIQRLRDDPEEVSLLFRDLLIGVTNFFRDSGAFEALQDIVIPKLFEDLGAGDTVRVWVPGCATGEEVYSIAILMRERLSVTRNAPKVQIFATDIDEAALAVARAGRYPEALLKSVSPERLSRFFSTDDSSYVIAKEIRDLCIFSPHSIVRDPPFSRIDLISCRNLLIYLGAEFQARVIPVFHFALRRGGYLFLGTSENISHHGELFHRIDRKQRLFQRRDNVTAPLQYPLFGGSRNVRAERRLPELNDMQQSQTPMSIRRAAEMRVLDQFAPANVVINRDGEIVDYSARTGKYLEAAVGMPSRQLLALARPGLRPDLRAVMREAMESGRTAVRDRVAVEFEDRVQAVTLTVEPLGNHETDPLFLVLFTDVGPTISASDAQALVRRADAPIEQVERELRDTRERLQAMSEEYETALEELKASNEEMVSVNEELQSTNEELETSKEELQSVNEELQTVNTELNSKVDELDRINTDLRNLFDSTRLASIFIDENLVIRSFTPAVTAIFNLIPTDRGRPLSDIVSALELGDLKRDVQRVVETAEAIERNVRKADGGVHYFMRILPYRGRQNRVDGAIVTFFEVTKMIEAEAQQRFLVEELNERVRTTLLAIGSLTQQSIKSTASVEQFSKTLQERIRAVGNAYTLLSRESWARVPLSDLLKIDLERHGKRVSFEGPDVAFPSPAALALAVVFHELGTNAVRFGAMSNAKGKLAVRWRIDGGKGRARRVIIHWAETGGPAVKAPKSKGLGSELVEREIKDALGGSVTRDYAKGGFKAQITVPLPPVSGSIG